MRIITIRTSAMFMVRRGETPQRLAGYETDSLTTLFLDHLVDHVGG